MGAPPPKAPTIGKVGPVNVDWKVRALVAEDSLRALRGLCHAVFRARNEYEVRPRLELDVAIDEMVEELCAVEDAHPPFDPFNQETKGLAPNFRISEVGGMTYLSRMSLKDSTIEVNSGAAPPAKLVGLLFQLVQLADVSCARAGSAFPLAQVAWIQDRMPSLLVLLLAAGLVNPEVPVTVADIKNLAASSTG